MGANDTTAWGGAVSEAPLDLKDPLSERDPNVTTRWSTPSTQKPAVVPKRPVDLAIEGAKDLKCLSCSTGFLSETGLKNHLERGGDGLTRCERDRKNYKPMTDCTACAGAGQVSGKDCEGCGGAGRVIDKAPTAPSALNVDELANKISTAIGNQINQGFALIAEALKGGKAPKVKRAYKPRKGKAHARPGGVREGTEDPGLESAGGVAQPEAPLADSETGPEAQA